MKLWSFELQYVALHCFLSVAYAFGVCRMSRSTFIVFSICLLELLDQMLSFDLHTNMSMFFNGC